MFDSPFQRGWPRRAERPADGILEQVGPSDGAGPRKRAIAAGLQSSQLFAYL